MLYLVSTPIGNLQDISYRAVEVLKKCDYILCEDTRHSTILLTRYEIDKPLKSFHLLNEKKEEDRIVHDLKAGKEIGLISDAGTPGICDPGEALVKRCRAEHLSVTALPGPCAWMMALSLSTFSKERVQFLGFFPQSKGERNKALASTLYYQGTTLFYEAPHRLVETLELLRDARKIAVARELTKTFEEYVEGTPSEILTYFLQKEVKGEIVVLVEGRGDEIETTDPIELVKRLQECFGLSLADAIKEAASLKGVPKKEIYRAVHRETDSPS